MQNSAILSEMHNKTAKTNWNGHNVDFKVKVNVFDVRNLENCATYERDGSVIKRFCLKKFIKCRTLKWQAYSSYLVS